VFFLLVFVGPSTAAPVRPAHVVAVHTESTPGPVITPSNTSTTVTTITLLMIAFGGMIGAATPLLLGIIKTWRKVPVDEEQEARDKEKQDAVVMALAAALAKAQSDHYVGSERRQEDRGPRGRERRGNA
jgi:hypothetical protein